MTKLATFFRLIVMMIAAVIAVEGWQRYGPSTTQLKSLATRALEVAQHSLKTSDLAGTASPGLVANQPQDAPGGLTTPAPESGVTLPVAATTELPTAPAIFAPATPVTAIGTASTKKPATTNPDADRLPALMSRLEELGGVEPELVAWGSSGQLYRFCCQAELSDAPNLKRHFESVAAEPSAAVQDVIAKVEAWRAAERNGSGLR
jgi:hypothetical protein